MPPIDPTPIAVFAGATWPLFPVLARIGSKPGMVLGFVTGILFAALTAAFGPAVGLSGDATLVVAVPGAFMLGFFVVGFGIAVIRR